MWLIGALQHVKLLAVYISVFLNGYEEPQSIFGLQKAGLCASPYRFKLEDGLKELGSRFLKVGDSLPGIFISRRCVNLISELLEYQAEVKEKDHTADTVRYTLKLQNYPPLNAFRFD